MSVTESKAKAPKTSKKTVKPAESAALKAALEAAQIEMVPLSALVKSPLNVRTIPYPAESVREMADSIGGRPDQNLVVHNCRTVCRGGCRWSSSCSPAAFTQRAAHRCRVSGDREAVSDELAVVASMVEKTNSSGHASGRTNRRVPHTG
jgi:ParB family chromosome partitioning protein